MITITLVNIKSYLSISSSFFVQGLAAIIILALLTCAVLNNVGAYALIFPIHANVTSTTNAVTPSNPPTSQQQQQQQQPEQPSQPNLHLVKITSPIKGQVVPVGKDLRISGTSLDNTTTTTASDCSYVAVKVNGVNPYHNATEWLSYNNYSKWNFTLIHPILS